MRESRIGSFAPEPAGLDAIGQFGQSLLYTPARIYEAGKAVGLDLRDTESQFLHDVGLPLKARGYNAHRTAKLGKAMGKAMYEDVRHPIRNAG